MRIAFIGQKGILGVGGRIEKNMEEISLRLAHKGHDVFVYTLPSFTPKEYKKYEKVFLISLPEIKIKFVLDFVYYLWGVFRACFIDRVSIIHWQKTDLIWLMPVFKIIKPSVKHVVNVGDKAVGARGFVYRNIFKLTTHFASSLVVNNTYVQRFLLQEYKLASRLIYNGVSLEELVGGLGALKCLGLERHKYITCYNPNLKVKHNKDLEYLVDTFINLKNKSMAWQSFKLVLLSRLSFTYGPKLDKLIREREDIVLVADQSRSSLAEILTHTFLTVCPSETDKEDLLECLGYERGVLVADAGDNLEVINSGLGRAIAFDFKYADKYDLNEKLSLLLLNPEIVRSVGNSAKRYIGLNYSWEKSVDELEKVYKQIVLVESLKNKVFKIPELAKV